MDDGVGSYRECNKDMKTKEGDYVSDTGPYQQCIGFKGTKELDFVTGAGLYKEELKLEAATEREVRLRHRPIPGVHHEHTGR